MLAKELNRYADVGCCINVSICHTRCLVLRERHELMRKRKTKEEEERERIESNKGSCQGRSILEIMEDELDLVVMKLMTKKENEDGGDKYRAEGLGLAIAIIRNPYIPDLEDVRERAMFRYRWEMEH